MNNAKPQTWAASGDRAKRARAAVIGLLVVVLGVGLLPVASASEYGPPGLNEAQIHLSHDGYDDAQQGFMVFGAGNTEVSGKGFKPFDLAQIFLCIEGYDLRGDRCRHVGASPTDDKGNFGPVPVVLVGGFFSADTAAALVDNLLERPHDTSDTGCFGGAAESRNQCEVVAATFDAVTGDLTARASHYVCFVSGGSGPTGCKPKPTGSWSTTTTTIPPKAGELTMSQDGYNGYYPGEPLRPVGGVGPSLPFLNAPLYSTPPINIEGRGFVPSDVVELFECLAGEKEDLHTNCHPLGTAPTSAEGEFTATVSLLNRWSNTLGGESGWCRGGWIEQCSVVAATFDHTDPGFQSAPLLLDVGNTEPTSRGENYICFEGPEPCANKPGAPVTSTTTTSTTVVPPPEEHHVADFDGNGSTDVSVFRPSNGMWYVKDGQWTAWGQEGDIPVPADYDGDGATDVAIFRPATGLWAIHHSGGGPDLFMTYGIAGDIPVVADYDGDKKADIAIFRPEYATWWVHRSTDGADVPTTFGISSDIPVPADYDGDDKADLAVYRDGTWFTLPSTGGSYTSVNHGTSGDIPVPADYDADADETTDLAVFRPSDGGWYVHNEGPVFNGASGDVPVPGHYDTDPFADVATFRPSTGEWLIEDQAPVSWGGSGDVPLPLPYAIYHAFFSHGSG